MRQPRRLGLLSSGTALAGVGIALLLDSGMGVSPIDAVFAGLADRVGMTVGAVMICLSILMLLVALGLGTRSGIGTLVCFFGIGVAVDATTGAMGQIGVSSSEADLWVRGSVWLLGSVVLGFAASMLMSSGLGASAYDQFVRSFTRFGLGIPRARFVVDVVALLAAFR